MRALITGVNGMDGSHLADFLLQSFGLVSFLLLINFLSWGINLVFKKELKSSQEDKSVWSKLFKVFFVDWVICVLGVLGTGVLFVVIFNQAH